MCFSDPEARLAELEEKLLSLFMLHLCWGWLLRPLCGVGDEPANLVARIAKPLATSSMVLGSVGTLHLHIRVPALEEFALILKEHPQGKWLENNARLIESWRSPKDFHHCLFTHKPFQNRAAVPNEPPFHFKHLASPSSSCSSSLLLLLFFLLERCYTCKIQDLNDPKR